MTRASGFKGARSRARARPDILDKQATLAITETVDVVHRTGRTNIDAMVKRRTGLLRRRYRKTVRKAQILGLVGYFTASARRAAFYARFVHDGTRYITARPFHDLAVAEYETSHSRRMRKALRQSLALASPSRLGRSGRGRVRGI
jgi:hypothetical protein